MTASGQVLAVTVTLRSQFLHFKLKVQSNMLFLGVQSFLQFYDGLIQIKTKYLTAILKTINLLEPEFYI